MIIGTLRERKDNENRVGIPPTLVPTLVSRGHKVLVESGAGLGSGYTDDDYKQAGARVHKKAKKVVSESAMIVKVKEPIPEEYKLLKLMRGKVLFTYLHLAGTERKLTELLLKHKVTAIAYEMVSDRNGGLPLLTPMSEIAGIQAVTHGAMFLNKKFGGKGKTLGKVTGVKQANTVVIGGGIVGKTAASTALGMGGRVTLLEKNPERKSELLYYYNWHHFGGLADNMDVLPTTEPMFSRALRYADLIIGAVSVIGAKAPCVLTKKHLRLLQEGTVIVDVSIDQGGCTAWSKPTTHSNPVYIKKGLVFCCITNIPGQVPNHATAALSSATLPYILDIAQDGPIEAAKKDPYLAQAINTHKGGLFSDEISKALDIPVSLLKF